MTNAEHLIENAICCLEQGESFEIFLSRKYNIDMAEMQKIDLQDIWLMAQYVVYALKPHWLWQKEDEMSEKYGYKLED